MERGSPAGQERARRCNQRADGSPAAAELLPA
jgi:hypothetical protein